MYLQVPTLHLNNLNIQNLSRCRSPALCSCCNKLQTLPNKMQPGDRLNDNLAALAEFLAQLGRIVLTKLELHKNLFVVIDTLG